MKKLSLVLLALLLCLSLVGCSGGGGGDMPSGGDTPAKKTILANVGFDPDTFDPQASNVMENAIVVQQMYSGLMRENPDGEFVLDLAAELPTISDDGLVYTFKIKENANFADGSPVTAEDVKYSWTRALDPNNAFDYAYQLYYIKNGEAYNAGEATADDLGLKVIDAKTLEVTLERPTPYFTGLTAFCTLLVISKDFAEKQATYGADLDSSLASGPFVPVEFNKGQYVRYEKNQNYWDKDSVKIDELYIYAVSESATEITMYETGALDMTYMTMSNADIKRYQNEGTLKYWSSANTRYIMVNNEKSPMNDPKVRKALSLALDRKSFVDNVIIAAVTAEGFVSNDMPAPDGSGVFTPENFLNDTPNVEEAKKLLAEAGYPDGAGWPEGVSIVYTTNETNKLQCEALVEMWRTNLGISITAQNVEGTVRRDLKRSGDYYMSWDGWTTDYMDPYSFMEILITGNIYNQGRYSSAEYDALVAEAANSNDQKVRNEKMAAAEKVAMDEMGAIPVYNSIKGYLESDKISGVVCSQLGTWDFKWADKAE